MYKLHLRAIDMLTYFPYYPIADNQDGPIVYRLVRQSRIRLRRRHYLSNVHFYIYILESIATGRWYIGSTQDVDSRLQYHNSGRVRSSKPYRPYRLIYTESFLTRSEAVKREMQIKRSGVIRKQIKESIQS